MDAKMKDIAREAGVSTATVGRVLHKRGYVSPDAKKRVETAVQKLGYVPNTLARALITNRSGIIGCLVVEHAGNLHQEISRVVLAAAEARGYRLFTMQTRLNVRDEDELIRQFIGLRVDGLVVISNIYLTREQLSLLRTRQVPVVAIERAYFSPGVDNVCFRDVEGAEEAVRHFLERGHRRVAFIGPKPFAQTEEDRLEGFRRAMAAAGIPEDGQTVALTQAYGIDEGRAAAQWLLALPEPPTGLFCTADSLAAGAMQALYARGVRVPQDISISGYDNRIARELAPPINSVEPDLDNLGGVTMDLLCARMERFDDAARTEWLRMRYVDRGTVTAL